MSTVVQQLKAARNLISDERRWIKEEYARDYNGRACSPLSRYARCFCSLGAVRRVCGTNTDKHPAFTYLDRVCDGGRTKWPAYEYNDTHTHAEVLSMFDRAIALAESEAA